ncbi:MAG: TlpA family protein disulfide reductase, partial [Acidimicrobiia bacterium]
MTETKKPKPGTKDAKSRSTLWWMIGGVVGLVLIVLLAASIATEPEIDESIGYGDPTVEGDPLPMFTSGAQDAAVGLPAPTVTGADWEGNPVSIEPDGSPKIVLFLAHWCPHCQNEVPVVQDWVDAGNLPDDVELISVATSTDRL